jgi:sortase A
MVNMFGGGGASRRKALAAGAAALAGVVTAVVIVTTLGGDDEPAAAAPATTDASTTVAPTTEATTTTAPTTTTSTTTTPPTTAPPTTAAPTTVPPTTAPPTTPPSTTVPVTTPIAQLEQPIAPPADEYAREPVIALGTLSIPEIGVEMTMYEGIRLTTLDLGPGHWPGSAMPGSPGNVVVGGHRTSKHKVFRKVDQLVAGDEVIFTGGDGTRHIYVVNRVEIVQPTDVWIIDPTPTPTATLFACHPPGSTTQRIVVFADFRETIPAA